MNNVKRPMPDGFEADAHMAINALRTKYGAGRLAVERWLDELGADRTGRKPSANRLPVPADFAEMARSLTRTGLVEHYRCVWQVMARWCKEAGVEPVRYVPVPVVRVNWIHRGAVGKATDLRQRTMYDEAADVLRQHCPVYRSDARGLFDPKGDFWRIGNGLLTPDELLKRAAKYRVAA